LESSLEKKLGSENGKKLWNESPKKQLLSGSREERQLDRQQWELRLGRIRSQKVESELEREKPSWKTSCSWVWNSC
jgi:hypothetical protein